MLWSPEMGSQLIAHTLRMRIPAANMDDMSSVPEERKKTHLFLSSVVLSVYLKKKKINVEDI